MTKKIIITDDDEDIIEILKMSLEDMDAEIKFYQSGEETVKSAMDFKPDLVVLDVMMPRMDGIETLNALRLLPTLENVPVIFLTAKAQRKEVEAYKSMNGVLGVITKPFDPMTLKETLLALIQKQQ